MSSVSDEKITSTTAAGEEEIYGDLIHVDDGQKEGGGATAEVTVVDEVSDAVQHGIECLCKPCEPLKILKLVERLSSTTSSIEMQIIINKYVSNTCVAGGGGGRKICVCVFILYS